VSENDVREQKTEIRNNQSEWARLPAPEAQLMAVRERGIRLPFILLPINY
jgi:hypothetical protein